MQKVEPSAEPEDLQELLNEVENGLRGILSILEETDRQLGKQ